MDKALEKHLRKGMLQIMLESVFAEEEKKEVGESNAS